MSHVLILGMTESGKTTLAKRMCWRYQARDVKTIVLDPLCDPQWQADFQTSDPDEFLETFWLSQRCAVFIDEAGQSVGKYNEVMQRTATRGRHWGHAVHFVTQRGVQLPVTVRDQCGHLFLFTTAKKDSIIHANEWNCEALSTSNTLAKGNYYHVTRFGALHRGSLFGAAHGTYTDPRNGGRELSGNEQPRSASTDAPNGRTDTNPGTDHSRSSDSTDTTGGTGTSTDPGADASAGTA